MASEVKRAIGQEGAGIVQIGEYFPFQPWVILREASYDELVADIIATGRTIPSSPCPYRYFYEVSVD